MAGFDPLFEKRLNAVLAAAEQATGGKRNIVEGWRSAETQAQYRANYLGQPVSWNGKVYQPLRKGGLAAPPGKSRHQIGQAADLGAGPVRDWAMAHAAQFGLEGLGAKDPPHIQLARGGKDVMGPVSSTVAGTTPSPAAAPTTPENSVADLFSKVSFGGGGTKDMGLGGNLPPAPEFNLPVASATETPAPAAAAPDLSPLAEVFSLPAIGQPGSEFATDPNSTLPGFIPGQARQPIKRLGL